MKGDIEKEMLAEIIKHHAQTQKLIKAAHDAVLAACKSATYVGQLVEKSSRHKKSTVYQWLSENAGIDGETGRAYKLAHTTAQTRRVESDRRALLRLGIIKNQVKTAPATKPKPAPRSLTTKVNAATKSIITHVETRPVSAMTQGERMMLKKSLEPLGRLYLEASA